MKKDKEYRVYIYDLSSEDKQKEVEIVSGFVSLDHANLFAQCYVRDSIERCRTPTSSAEEVYHLWLNFGEDVKVLSHDEILWDSRDEVNGFIENGSSHMQRNWRSIDPRALKEED
ncbi:hypothetical protein [Commensalibacter sp. Nvir]|uniref:hypothetical protein n=1 Tax=Commensalibacter sp. Nvir TaxID=3069817 RepID=UPI0030C8C94A